MPKFSASAGKLTSNPGILGRMEEKTSGMGLSATGIRKSPSAPLLKVAKVERSVLALAPLGFETRSRKEKPQHPPSKSDRDPVFAQTIPSSGSCPSFKSDDKQSRDSYLCRSDSSSQNTNVKDGADSLESQPGLLREVVTEFSNLSRYNEDWTREVKRQAEDAKRDAALSAFETVQKRVGDTMQSLFGEGTSDQGSSDRKPHSSEGAASKDPSSLKQGNGK